MGTECLLDLLADRISNKSGTNIVRITDRRDVTDRSHPIDPDVEYHVLLYVDIDDDEYDIIAGIFSHATIYRAKELCHQVPMCFKGSAER